MIGIRFVTVALLLGVATPAAAQDRLWGHSGAWEGRQGEINCTFRYRARDAAETEIVVEQRHGYGIELEASGKGWRHGSGPPHGLILEGDGAIIYSDKDVQAADTAPGRSGFSIYIQPDSLRRILASRRIAVRLPGNRENLPVILMPPSVTVEQDLAACIADVGTREGGSGEPAVTPPLSRGAVSSWTTADDYPMSARRAGIGGHLRVRLQVNAFARVTGCEVVESTGNAQLDSTYCSLYRRRARFATPPRDARGRPTRGSFDIVMALVPVPLPPVRYIESRKH